MKKKMYNLVFVIRFIIHVIGTLNIHLAVVLKYKRAVNIKYVLKLLFVTNQYWLYLKVECFY